jgi:hypothetical protein
MACHYHASVDQQEALEKNVLQGLIRCAALYNRSEPRAHQALKLFKCPTPVSTLTCFIHSSLTHASQSSRTLVKIELSSLQYHFPSIHGKSQHDHRSNHSHKPSRAQHTRQSVVFITSTIHHDRPAAATVRAAMVCCIPSS